MPVNWGPFLHIKDLEWADDLTLFADSIKEAEQDGVTLMDIFINNGVGMNDKTEARAFGKVRKTTVEIGSWVLGGLKAPFKYLGIWIQSNIGPKKHQDERIKKGIKAIGKLNQAWARNKSMTFMEEWQLWNAYGWSSLSFGMELWAWDNKEVEKVRHTI